MHDCFISRSISSSHLELYSTLLVTTNRYYYRAIGSSQQLHAAMDDVRIDRSSPSSPRAPTTYVYVQQQSGRRDDRFGWIAGYLMIDSVRAVMVRRCPPAQSFARHGHGDEAPPANRVDGMIIMG
jgi:hypothetical protein